LLSLIDEERASRCRDDAETTEGVGDETPRGEHAGRRGHHVRLEVLWRLESAFARRSPSCRSMSLHGSAMSLLPVSTSPPHAQLQLWLAFLVLMELELVAILGNGSEGDEVMTVDTVHDSVTTRD